ncbi:40S ribosomal protein S19 [Tardisphaera saccharovorans]
MEKLNYRAVSSQYLVGPLATRLKSFEQITQPAWANYAKTATFKQSLPQDPDWWYKRVASVLVKLSQEPTLGVSRLSSTYGGRIISRAKPHHVARGSRKTIRIIIDQLEQAGLIAISGNAKVLTPTAEALLNDVARGVVEKMKKEEPRLEIYNWAF